MFSKWQWILGHLTRALWLRATLMALLAIVVVFAAMLADRLLPFELPFEAEQNTLDNILNILASSMLAVTTFSLTVMVSAYSAATSNVTPRATKLIRQDTTTQNVLATFIGSFLFSLVGIIAIHTARQNNKNKTTRLLYERINRITGRSTHPGTCFLGSGYLQSLVLLRQVAR